MWIYLWSWFKTSWFIPYLWRGKVLMHWTHFFPTVYFCYFCHFIQLQSLLLLFCCSEEKNMYAERRVLSCEKWIPRGLTVVWVGKAHVCHLFNDFMILHAFCTCLSVMKKKSKQSHTINHSLSRLLVSCLVIFKGLTCTEKGMLCVNKASTV